MDRKNRKRVTYVSSANATLRSYGMKQENKKKKKPLKVLAIIQIPQMIAMVCSGALRGAGDTKSPFYIALVSMWGVRVTGVLLCTRVFHLGLTAVCISMCVDNVVRFILFMIRYRSEPWKKNIV